MSKFKILAVNDDKDFCQCCGKTGLKSVVWIENQETGQIQHFGSICAINPLKAFGFTKKDITAKVSKQKKEQAAERMRTIMIETQERDRKFLLVKKEATRIYVEQGFKLDRMGRPESFKEWQSILVETGKADRAA